MSHYFTRLAARTGLHAPKAAGAPAADIVEQSVEIEAAYPAPTIARSAAPQKSAAAPARGKEPSAAPSAPIAKKTSDEAATYKEETALTRPPMVKTLRSDPPIERRLDNRAAERAPAPPPSTEEEVTRGNVTGVTDEPRRTGPAPAFYQVTAAPVAPKIAAATPETTLASPPPHARGQETSLRSAPAAEKFLQPASAPRAAAENRFVAPGRAPENSALAARSQSTPPPAANDVAVHIGAIKVEIHPPARAAPPPAPRVENIPERPRFEPRRHYLRW